MPQISVIVPVYNVEPYLCRCVDSILNQSFSDFELILVDDGSPDRCGIICDEYARREPRIHVIHQENGGLSAARNAGTDWVEANSNSQWIAYIDSDDWIHIDYLAHLYELACRFNVPLVMCGFLPTDKITEDKPIANCLTTYLTAEDAYSDYYDCVMHAWGKLVSRELMTKYRFPKGKIHEDAYVTHLLTFDAGNTAVSTAQLYYYYCNPDSITRVKWSEKRLHQFEGHELRLRYLKENSYARAYRAEVNVYTQMLFNQMQDIRIQSKEDPTCYKYMEQLYPKSRKAFAEARRLGLLPYCEENVWIYELAYPMKLFWFLRNVIKNVLNKRK